MVVVYGAYRLGAKDYAGSKKVSVLSSSNQQVRIKGSYRDLNMAETDVMSH